MVLRDADGAESPADTDPALRAMIRTTSRPRGFNFARRGSSLPALSHGREASLDAPSRKMPPSAHPAQSIRPRTRDIPAVERHSKPGALHSCRSIWGCSGWSPRRQRRCDYKGSRPARAHRNVGRGTSGGAPFHVCTAVGTARQPNFARTSAHRSLRTETAGVEYAMEAASRCRFDCPDRLEMICGPPRVRAARKCHQHFVSFVGQGCRLQPSFAGINPQVRSSQYQHSARVHL